MNLEQLGFAQVLADALRKPALPDPREWKISAVRMVSVEYRSNREDEPSLWVMADGELLDIESAEVSHIHEVGGKRLCELMINTAGGEVYRLKDLHLELLTSDEPAPAPQFAQYGSRKLRIAQSLLAEKDPDAL